MKVRLWTIAAIAGAAGLAIGFAAGARFGDDTNQLRESYFATAGHTRTYVSIARYLRKDEPAEALRLVDAMIAAGASRLSEPSSKLDRQTRTYVDESFAVVQEYGRQYPARKAQ